MKRALILVGHGSRLRGFQAAMLKVVQELRRGHFFDEVRCAYLEINSPSIPRAIDASARKGMKKIFILPYFLLRGKHTQKDIPALVAVSRSKHRGRAAIVLCRYPGFHKKLVEIIRQRVREAE
ncbi:MAG: CbiX/SirB N-terminal domain-containing protein [Candidatus Omnitrophica bacterium]|nr:CbiX/SirB N-terminal domain-containing protein [Candidatus Omnitrophota bacterium]